MSLIERQSGTIMRFGNGTEHGGLDIYHGRTQREVHPARRDETISFRWEIDPDKMQPRRDDNGWEHYSYRFTYRYLGRTLSVAWKCGTGYGTPKPFDGLSAAFSDAGLVAYEAFNQGWAEGLGMDWETPADIRKATRLYDLCEAMEHRIAAFFGDEHERTLWENILQAIDNGTEHFIVHTHERIAA
jgi:hypothetical protein